MEQDIIIINNNYYKHYHKNVVRRVDNTMVFVAMQEQSCQPFHIPFMQWLK